MNLPLTSALYFLVAVAGGWLALLWLWPRRTRSRRLGVLGKTIAGAATVLLLFLPVDGVALWNRAFSFYANPSLPMLGIVCAALWLRLFGLTVFQSADWNAIWLFGALGGSLLYLNPMLFGALDLYYWGWDRPVAAWTLGTLTVLFLGLGSRLGVLLLAALAGFALSALESANCWDYVMDPFYWLISLAVVSVKLVLAGLRLGARNSPPAVPQLVPAGGADDELAMLTSTAPSASRTRESAERF